jgi:hypothetical protein
VGAAMHKESRCHHPFYTAEQQCAAILGIAFPEQFFPPEIS